MHRSLQYPCIHIPDRPRSPIGDPVPKRVPFIWTGRVADGDCLVDPKLKGCPPDLAGSSIADLKPHGADCAGGSGSRHSRKRKRQDSGSCPLIVRPGDSSNGGGGQGDPLTYKPGEPSPTCAAGCGKLCTGYYCAPTPTGTPPDFWDPEDPAHPPQTLDTKPPQPPSISTPPSTTSSQAPPATPTAYLEINFAVYNVRSKPPRKDLEWWFYAGAMGQKYNTCSPSTIESADGASDPENPPYPQGTFELPSVNGMKGCVYKGTAQSPGSVTVQALATQSNASICILTIPSNHAQGPTE